MSSAKRWRCLCPASSRMRVTLPTSWGTRDVEVPPGDPHALAGALESMLARNNLSREQLGKLARIRVEERVSLSRPHPLGSRQLYEEQAMRRASEARH